MTDQAESLERQEIGIKDKISTFKIPTFETHWKSSKIFRKTLSYFQ